MNHNYIRCMLMRKIFFLFSLVFLIGNNLFSQKGIISLPSLNIFYVGILNEVHIGLEGYKTSEIIKEISDGEFIVKDGKTFVKVKNRGQVWIKIGIRKNGQNIWKDSLEFRVREMPKPTPQVGTMQDGSIESIGVIRANTNKMFMVFESSSYIKGIKTNIISFRFSVLDGLGIQTTNIKGNYFNGSAFKILSNLKYGAILIDEIYYDITFNGDTILKNQKSENDVFIKVGNNQCKFSLKGSFLELKEPIILNEEKINDQLIFIFSNNTKHGLWVDSSNPAELYKEYYDSGKLVKYSVYDKNCFQIIDVNIPKNADSVYYKEIYPNGYTKREGWVVVNHDEIELRITYGYENEAYFYDLKFVPTGKWLEYYENGKPKSEVNFMLLKNVIFTSDYSDHSSVNKIEEMTSYLHGVWKTYDEKGYILKEFLFNKGHKNIIKQ